MCTAETQWLSPFYSCLTVAQRILFRPTQYSLCSSGCNIPYFFYYYFWNKFSHLWCSAGLILDTITLWRTKFDTKCPMSIESFKIKSRFCYITVSLTEFQLFIKERWELQNLRACFNLYLLLIFSNTSGKKKKYKLKNLQGLYVMKIKFYYKIW